MKKLYVLLHFHDYECTEIVGIFNSMDKLNVVKSKLACGPSMRVEECILNKETDYCSSLDLNPVETDDEGKIIYKGNVYKGFDGSFAYLKGLDDIYNNGFRYLEYNGEIYELKSNAITITCTKLPNVTVDDIKSK